MIEKRLETGLEYYSPNLHLRPIHLSAATGPTHSAHLSMLDIAEVTTTCLQTCEKKTSVNVKLQQKRKILKHAYETTLLCYIVIQ